MTRRVYIGNNAGSFLFRASQPGVDAVTGDISRMAAFDLQSPMVPKAQGTVSIPAGGTGGWGTTTVGTGVAFAYPPFILLKESNGIVIGEASIWCRFDANSNQIVFFSYVGSVTSVKWWAFAEL